MCHNCRPDRYNPNCCDQSMEGVEMQRMDPTVERLVTYAERNGYLKAENRHVTELLGGTQVELRETEETLQRTKRELTYARNDVEAVVKERDAALRKVPKKPKKVTKKAKK